MDALKDSCPVIASIDLRGNKIKLLQTDDVIPLVNKMPTLKELDLRENNIKPPEEKKYKGVFKSITTLEMDDQITDSLWDDEKLVLALIRNNETTIDQLLTEMNDGLFTRNIMLEISKNQTLKDQLIEKYNDNGDILYFSIIARICFEDPSKINELSSQIKTEDNVLITILKCIEDGYKWNLHGNGIGDHGAKIISKLFKAVPDLVSLDLSCIYIYIFIIIR